MIDSNFVILAASSFAFGAFVSYAAWCLVRVLFIRQELFAVRDSLWDRARDLDGFNDPAYQQARDHLNAGIKVVPSCSVSLLKYTMKHCRGAAPTRIKSQNPELQAAIDEAYSKSARWFAKYILYWRASGWLFMVSISLKALQDITIRWLQSQAPAELAAFDDRLQSRGAA